MRVIVSYDISDDDARRHVAGLLEDAMTRVQYSVFEGDPPDELLVTKLGIASGRIDPISDSIRVYRLCRACAARVETHGRERPTKPPDIGVY